MKKCFSKLALVFFTMLYANLCFANDNVKAQTLSVTPGETCEIVLLFNGTANSDVTYSTCQFDLTLPEGLTIATTKKGTKYIVNASEITPGDVPSANYSFTVAKADNVYSFRVMTMAGDEFVKNSGVLCKIKATASSDMTPGLFDLSITNIILGSYGEFVTENVDTETSEASAVGGAAITINSDGYATACSAKALNFSEVSGVEEVFTVSKVADNSATLSPIETKAVPANAGVVVKGTSGIVFVPFAEGSVDALGTNLLVGVTTATAIAAGSYILQGKEFVSCIAGTLPGGKAYLPASVTSSGAKAFTFDFGDTTGINEIQKAETEGAIYNLSGMRVSKTQKGVYIMNGRKVIVK